MLFQDTDATAGQQIYACESGAWVLQGDGGGGGGGDNITVNTTAATNANLLDNLYIDWALNAASTPDDITSKFNYAETLAGNPALLTTECIYMADGLMCEGTTADTIEIKLAFPDPATTDKTLTLPNATDTLVGKDTTDTLTNKTMTAAANVLDADTAVALAADPADCVTSTHFAVGVTASGAAACEAIADADVPNTITIDLATLATTATTANAGDSATSFFSSGTLEVAIGGTGTTTSTGTGAVVLGTSPTFTTSIVVPNGTNPTIDAAGKIAVDTSVTTGSGIRFYGDAAYTLPGYYSKSLVITGATTASDSPFWRTPWAITIRAVHCLVVGGTNVIGQLDEYDANGANAAVVDSADITCTTTNANDDGTLSNPSIDAGDYLGWHTTSVSGTNTRTIITWEFTVDGVL